MLMKRLAFFTAAGFALAGCASIQPSSPYLGRPIAEVVGELGPPETIADYQSGGRHFSWSTSDVRVQFGEAANPANWLEPMTRADAPGNLEEIATLPDYIVSPRFRPGPCSFTLIAEWDVAAKAWIARKAIRKDAGRGGHCGLRVVEE